MVLSRLTAFVVLAAALVSPGLAARAEPGGAGTIRGHVELRRILAAARPVPRDLTAPDHDPGHQPREEYRRAVVYLEATPELIALGTGPAGRAQIRQKNQTFVPHLLAVTTGTTVDFPNDDTIYHNVFSLSKTRRFDLGRYAVGRSKSVTFNKPGVVRVFCDIHSEMSAFILVMPHRFFAVTDTDGRFRIEGVPPGTYQVTAWYEGVATRTLDVTVTDGAAVNTAFILEQP